MGLVDISNQGGEVNISTLIALTVIYIYLMTGRPEIALADGWEKIPSARGCTPQAYAFMDHSNGQRNRNSTVYGLKYLSEVFQRIYFPF